MIILEKCAIISCNREVYEDENRVLRYCLGHVWLDWQYQNDWQTVAISMGGYNGPSD